MSMDEYNEWIEIECYKMRLIRSKTKTRLKQGRSVGVPLSRVFHVSLSYALISSYNGLLPSSSQPFRDLWIFEVSVLSSCVRYGL